jgi:hypothetical protein
MIVMALVPNNLIADKPPDKIFLSDLTAPHL